MATLSLWEYKDTLRQMTEKFNAAVEAIIALQESTGSVNTATSEQLQQIQTTFEQELENIKTELNSKVNSVTVEDLHLENVDNTSDLDKPVSTATQQAIDAAVEDMATTEEVGDELVTDNLYDPDISAPVKQYIEERLAELFTAYTGGEWQPEYNIATDTKLGVIKSGSEVTVDQNTGKLTIPALNGILVRITTLETNVTALSSSLETNNAATSQLVQDRGIMSNLQTTNKSSIVGSINEIHQLIKELDEG